jgi:hypothetical protein
MTIIKPNHIEGPTFTSVREAGYAEDEVDEFIKGAINSYNRMIDMKHDSDVKAENLENENSELVTENSRLANELEVARTELTVAQEALAPLQKEIEFANTEIAAARKSRDESFAQTSAVITENNTLTMQIEDIRAEKNAIAEAADSLQNRVYELENQLSVERETAEAAIASANAIATDAVNQAELISAEAQRAAAAYETNSAYSAPAPYVAPEVAPVAAATLQTPDEGKQDLNGVLNDSSAPLSDRAARLLNKAYELGEEYIDSAHVERTEILGDANEQAAALVAEADARANAIVADAEDKSEAIRTLAIAESEAVREAADIESKTIILEAKLEAEHVANSVVLLREERDETLGRLRDFFVDARERVEEIASLPDYDEVREAEAAAELALLNDYSPEVNTDFAEAEDKYYEDQLAPVYYGTDNDSSTEEETTGVQFEEQLEEEILEADELDESTVVEEEDYNAPAPVEVQVEAPVYEQVPVSEYEPEVIAPSVEPEDTYLPSDEEANPAEFHNPTGVVNTVREGNLVWAEEEEPAEGTNTNPNPQYGSFTDVLNIPAREKDVPAEDTEEPKKKKGGFMSFLKNKE